MKRMVAFCSLILLFIACSKKKDTQPSYITATIKGQEWTGADLHVAATGKSASATAEYNGSKIYIAIPDTVKKSYYIPQVTEVTGAVIQSFSVSSAESDYQVEWSTSGESGDSRFVIEAATSKLGPTQFIPIDTVVSKGAGNQTYQTIVNIPSEPYNEAYFRLKGLDVNNQPTYSQVRSLNGLGYAFYSAPGQHPRRGFSTTITVTGKEDPYVMGTFQFSIRTITGELIRIENGRFRMRYR